MRLIALDMDGTLLNSEKKISPATAQAMKEASEKGKYVCLSTGRPLAELADYEDVFPYLSYGILISGGALYDFRNKVYLDQIILSDEMKKAVAQAVKGRDVMVQLLTDQNSVVQKNQLAHIEDYGMGIYRPLYEHVSLQVDSTIAYGLSDRENVLKMNLYHRSAKDREETYNRLKDLPLSLAYAETTSLEITPLGVNKGDGLKKLCAHLHIDVKDCIAVGDAPNDLAVLKTAGMSVAMGNASDEIKSVCDDVTDDNDHDGVKAVIEKYLLGEENEA